MKTQPTGSEAPQRQDAATKPAPSKSIDAPSDAQAAALFWQSKIFELEARREQELIRFEEIGFARQAIALEAQIGIPKARKTLDGLQAEAMKSQAEAEDIARAIAEARRRYDQAVSVAQEAAHEQNLADLSELALARVLTAEEIEGLLSKLKPALVRYDSLGQQIVELMKASKKIPLAPSPNQIGHGWRFRAHATRIGLERWIEGFRLPPDQRGTFSELERHLMKALLDPADKPAKEATKGKPKPKRATLVTIQKDESKDAA